MIPGTPNSWTDFLALEPVLGAMSLLEKRMENDSLGKILYIGYSMVANADTSANLWMIRKFSYDVNGFMDRDQLPKNGIGFLYSWDDRATSFS
jgi:hypothetical protein